MAALASLTSQPFKAPAAAPPPAQPSSALGSLVAAPHTSPTAPQPPKSLSELTATPFITAAPPAPSNAPSETVRLSPGAASGEVSATGAGGAFSAPGGNIEKLVNTGHTSYGGEPSVKGFERDDIVPVSLGGQNNNPDNISLQPMDQASYRDNVEKYYAAQYKAGKVPLNAARDAVLNWKNTDIPGQVAFDRKLGGPQTVPGQFLSSLTEMPKKIVDGVHAFFNAPDDSTLGIIKNALKATQPANSKSLPDIAKTLIARGVPGLTEGNAAPTTFGAAVGERVADTKASLQQFDERTQAANAAMAKQRAGGQLTDTEKAAVKAHFDDLANIAFAVAGNEDVAKEAGGLIPKAEAATVGDVAETAAYMAPTGEKAAAAKAPKEIFPAEPPFGPGSKEDPSLAPKVPKAQSALSNEPDLQLQETPPRPVKQGKTANNKGNFFQLKDESYDKVITDHNGGVTPPVNRGGLQPPEIDFSKAKAKDIAALRLSTDTMERNVEKVFGDQGDKINDWLINPIRENETKRVKWLTAIRGDLKENVVKKLGIKPGSAESAMVQRYGEKRASPDEVKAAFPKTWQNITQASDILKTKYQDLLKEWNGARTAAGLKPVAERPDYFRHFLELNDFSSKFGFNFRETNLPTQISGLTDMFKSSTPWASAANRRFNGMFTEDAIKGMDNYLDTTSRAIFHTDSVQRGRLFEKYLRDAATAAPDEVKLPNFVANLNDWTNIVSGKQAKLDRAMEGTVGRSVLAPLRALTRRFGSNVIGGNVSAAVTHSIPLSFTLATVDKGAAFQGLLDTLRSPFLEDFTKIGDQESSFLTRRFGVGEISPTKTQIAGKVLGSPFRWVDQFISRFAVSAKYSEGIADGLAPEAAMKEADNYAGRVIGDRSTGNLPNLMNTKTLGFLTQFQIEVNDNLRVLMHDIPRWENHDPGKIAGRLTQFAMASYLFNQVMQSIKGSGKGLDPIDLGLTLSGLNDEGHDQTLSQRLGLVTTDLAKELPFSSIPTSGQIPAVQPLIQGVSDISSGVGAGDFKKAGKGAIGLASTFASPIGGGQQAVKTYGGIEAWRKGYVTDANGNVTAHIPQTGPELLKGVLFGKSAFPEVKKTKTEVERLSAILKQQQATTKGKDQQATAIWSDLQGMDPAQAKEQLSQIATQDPDMARRVVKVAKTGATSATNITREDNSIKALGVTNGQRAKYIVSRLNDLPDDDAKKKYLSDLAAKKIVTTAVLTQIAGLMKQ